VDTPFENVMDDDVAVLNNQYTFVLVADIFGLNALSLVFDVYALHNGILLVVNAATYANACIPAVVITICNASLNVVVYVPGVAENVTPVKNIFPPLTITCVFLVLSAPPV
jgi:hypothetical protein